MKKKIFALPLILILGVTLAFSGVISKLERHYPTAVRAATEIDFNTVFDLGNLTALEIAQIDSSNWETILDGKAAAAGTEGVFKVSIRGSLVNLSALVNERGASFEGKTIYLTDDINCGIMTGNNHTRIGLPENPFMGTFDGQGFEISGVDANAGTEQHINVGIFGYVVGAEIKNLVVSGEIRVSTLHLESIAGVAGFAQDSIIVNCVNKIDIVNDFGAKYVGGIVGIAKDSQIINCFNYGDLDGEEHVGGIAGALYDSGSIINCANFGELTCDGATLASIVSVIGWEDLALPEFTIENIYNDDVFFGDGDWIYEIEIFDDDTYTSIDLEFDGFLSQLGMGIGDGAVIWAGLTEEQVKDFIKELNRKVIHLENEGTGDLLFWGLDGGKPVFAINGTEAIHDANFMYEKLMKEFAYEVLLYLYEDTLDFIEGEESDLDELGDPTVSALTIMEINRLYYEVYLVSLDELTMESCGDDFMVFFQEVSGIISDAIETFDDIYWVWAVDAAEQNERRLKDFAWVMIDFSYEDNNTFITGDDTLAEEARQALDDIYEEAFKTLEDNEYEDYLGIFSIYDEINEIYEIKNLIDFVEEINEYVDMIINAFDDVYWEWFYDSEINAINDFVDARILELDFAFDEKMDQIQAGLYQDKLEDTYYKTLATIYGVYNDALEVIQESRANPDAHESIDWASFANTLAFAVGGAQTEFEKTYAEWQTEQNKTGNGNYIWIIFVVLVVIAGLGVTIFFLIKRNNKLGRIIAYEGSGKFEKKNKDIIVKAEFLAEKARTQREVAEIVAQTQREKALALAQARKEAQVYMQAQQEEAERKEKEKEQEKEKPEPKEEPKPEPKDEKPEPKNDEPKEEQPKDEPKAEDPKPDDKT